MKKLLIKGMAAALSLTLALGTAGAYDTPDFSDVPPEHWAYDTIMEMADAGVIHGVGDGRFAPEEKLSSAMFTALLVRVFSPDLKTEGADPWYMPYQKEADRLQLYGIKKESYQDVDGVWKSRITPESAASEVTRYEMAWSLQNAVQHITNTWPSNDEAAKNFSDYDEFSSSDIIRIGELYALGLITGDENGRFNGESTISRAEAAVIISRLMAMKAKADAEKPSTEIETTFVDGMPIPAERYVPQSAIKLDLCGVVKYLLDGSDMLPAAGAHIIYITPDRTHVLGEGYADEDGNFRIQLQLEASWINAGQTYSPFAAVSFTDPDGNRWQNYRPGYDSFGNSRADIHYYDSWGNAKTEIETYIYLIGSDLIASQD